MQSKTYTQEQLDIKLLQSKNDEIGQTLNRINSRIDNIDNRLNNLDSKITGQYSNFTNYILGIYGLILASTLARATGIL